MFPKSIKSFLWGRCSAVLLTCSQGTDSGCGQESKVQKEVSRIISRVRAVCYIITDVSLVQGSETVGLMR